MCIDSHVHLSLDGIDFQKSRKRLKDGDYSQIENILEEYKKRNIYALRDGGDNLDLSSTIKNIAHDIGIIYKTPINSFYKKGYYGSFTGNSVTNTKDFREKFYNLMKKKPDHLKIILTGVVDFENCGDVGGTGFSFEELYYMSQCAKDKDLPIMVHANSPRAVTMAIKAGANTIEHGYFITDQELHLMIDNDVVWVPTLSPLGNLITCDDLKYRLQMSNIKKIYNLQIENVKKAYAMGVKIAVGSDAGAYKVRHAQGFYDEIDHFEKAGICIGKSHELAFYNGVQALGLKGREIKDILEKINSGYI